MADETYRAMPLPFSSSSGCTEEALRESEENFRTFFEWFREREDLENENRRHRESPAESGESPFPDPQLEAVRRALRSFMPE